MSLHGFRNTTHQSTLNRSSTRLNRLFFTCHIILIPEDWYPNS